MNTFLRYAEYYGMLEIFDDLYKRSLEDKMEDLDLLSIITSKNNILLAYRTIKSNTGSKTCGTDGLNIENYKYSNENIFINEIQDAFNSYKPHSVKRIWIPKANGKKRPLGIPTMKDRLVQQCIKQVLEPICEAKFYNHSYGFRPNRSTHDAMARCQSLVNVVKLHHIVDVDIQGFFDNVNHSKLLKQLYTIGVKDKRVLAIISKMLKAPIKGEGIPTKGTPQGGILSPLLANVVLNDLDWWVANQWEHMKTRYKYNWNTDKQHALKKTKLKRMFIVRYADDFKIFTDSHEKAIKIYYAVKGYLKDRLGLDVSTEKTMVTNLRRNKSEFLGFSLKAVKKKTKYVANTHVSEKKTKEIKESIKQRIKEIQKSPTYKNLSNYNSYVLGIHNYYKIATHVNLDFGEIAYCLNKTLYNRLKKIGKKGVPKNPNETYRKFYKNNYETFEISRVYLYPIADIKFWNATNFTHDKCNYTKRGRELLEHKYLSDMVMNEIKRLENSNTEYYSMEYTDNRISKYSMQMGKCAVTSSFLLAEDIHCHHILPRQIGGTDEYKNLVIVSKDIHILIHATDEKTIERYMNKLQLDDKQLKKLNMYRKKCNLEKIVS